MNYIFGNDESIILGGIDRESSFLYINHLNMILTSTDSLKLIMENNLAIDKCLRVFSQFKFVMVLNGNLL